MTAVLFCAYSQFYRFSSSVQPLPSKPAALPHSPFCRYATSSPGRGKSALKGTASVVAGNFAAALKGVPLGELSRSD